MWPNPQEPADLVTFIEEILNGKLHFLCSVWCVLENRFMSAESLAASLDIFPNILQLKCVTPYYIDKIRVAAVDIYF